MVRPPKLLLGSTSYGVTADLWSVCCIVAELFFRRPLLKGRTEVEKLHKVFKLCGSPLDDYWKRYKLPLATMFKPKKPYYSTLRDRCKELLKSVVKLIETLLSIDPYKRGAASSALNSELRGVLNANGEQNGGSATFTKDCKDDYVMELQRPCSVIVW
ncbi:hypothetical protein FXO37_20883 [Capsicum annuum]|nr:hypothetical protein FXO37_20883 [Capsicum annuum]